MVPSVDDTCSDVLSLRGSLLCNRHWSVAILRGTKALWRHTYTGSFPDVNCQIRLGSTHVDVPGPWISHFASLAAGLRISISVVDSAPEAVKDTVRPVNRRQLEESQKSTVNEFKVAGTAIASLGTGAGPPVGSRAANYTREMLSSKQ